ncbi:fibronectin type III domain-containing protein [Pyxidicoccus fallax]|uniref:Fibronectin type III domain-containing protein n=1 Tax=Pyxidicoccus fallax TaxID=394095 RepID=A0A848LP69_9BACT|nr:fibronectin type III domain-containing protein [Pyxidicoccus fallax]NMO19324.1 fibronectin type III domain-containing protein [Pyxidicoccus fallax]NPC80016.1 fibronectin type III domain-containing protein [Pyxidicoccus fallax]
MGCSDDPEPGPNVPDNAVRVRRFTRHLTASGFEERPHDFAQAPVELFVVQGDNLVPVTGAPGKAGEYVFPDVPRETYYLKQYGGYIVTDSRDIDLSTHVLGRPDIAEVQASGMASVALDGLEAWDDVESDLQLVSEQVGFHATLFASAETGSTSLTQEEVFIAPDTGPSMVRFEAQKGDRAWVVQLNSRTLGTLPGGQTQRYTTAVRALQLPPFSYDGSQPLRLAGTLQPLTMNELALDWKVSRFAELASEVHPSATLRSSSFSLFPMAFGTEEGWVGYSGYLLALGRRAGEASDATGTLVYGNPYPSNWGVLAQASSSFGVTFDIPGQEPFTYTSTIVVSDRVASLSDGPIVPLMRPPRALTLDGTEAYSARTVAPGAHVLSWQPPAAGTPNLYVVTLRRIDDLGDSTRVAVPALTFYVPANLTSVRMPAGHLEPGKHYFVSVRAVHAPGYDIARKPFVLAEQVTESGANTMSGLLTVPAR